MIEKAEFAAGCFWGVEASFRALPGVQEAVCGYSGGRTENPTYEQVCAGDTGHAESVEVTFDPGKISFEQLVRAFFDMHDPTTMNRQGPDVGDQYRSAVFARDPAQKAQAEKVKAELEAAKRFKRPIVTAITPASRFWRAEEYHQLYFAKHGMKGCHL